MRRSKEGLVGLPQIEQDLIFIRRKWLIFQKSFKFDLQCCLTPQLAYEVGWKLPQFTKISEGLGFSNGPTCYSHEFILKNPRRSVMVWTNGEQATEFLWREYLRPGLELKACANFPSANLQAAHLAAGMYFQLHSILTYIKTGCTFSQQYIQISALKQIRRGSFGFGLTKLNRDHRIHFTLGGTFQPKKGVSRLIMLYESLAGRLRFHFIQRHKTGHLFASFKSKPSKEGMNQSRFSVGIDRKGRNSEVLLLLDCSCKLKSFLNLRVGRVWLGLGSTLTLDGQAHFNYHIQLNLRPDC